MAVANPKITWLFHISSWNYLSTESIYQINNTPLNIKTSFRLRKQLIKIPNREDPNVFCRNLFSLKDRYPCRYYTCPRCNVSVMMTSFMTELPITLTVVASSSSYSKMNWVLWTLKNIVRSLGVVSQLSDEPILWSRVIPVGIISLSLDYIVPLVRRTRILPEHKFSYSFPMFILFFVPSLF